MKTKVQGSEHVPDEVLVSNARPIQAVVEAAPLLVLQPKSPLSHCSIILLLRPSLTNGGCGRVALLMKLRGEP